MVCCECGKLPASGKPRLKNYRDSATAKSAQVLRAPSDRQSVDPVNVPFSVLCHPWQLKDKVISDEFSTLYACNRLHTDLIRRSDDVFRCLLYCCTVDEPFLTHDEQSSLMSNPTPLQSLLGGVGLAIPIQFHLVLNGSVLGISGFVHNAVLGRKEALASVAGFLMGGAIIGVLEGIGPGKGSAALARIGFSGLLVGIGTKVASNT